MSRTARARFTSDPSLQPVFEAKLASSGLTLDHARDLGLRALDVAQVRALGTWPESRPALLIPYHDLDGEDLSDLPAGEPFYRLRYLGSDTSFTAAAKAEKPKRYAQPPRTAPCVYLPRSVDWRAIAEGTGDLLITEGELKAAKACAEGFPCVGLGGVWSFRSAEHGVLFNKVLERFTWLRRNVYLVFDSDLATNPNVAAALTALAYELQQRGAYAHVVWLPELLGAGEKVGLDDFLVFHGDKAGEELGALLRQGDLLGIVDPLLRLNEEWVLVLHPGLLVNRRTRDKYKPDAMRSFLTTENVIVRELAADGVVKHKKTSAGNEWMKWPLRTQASAVTYAPGRPEFIRNGRCWYNTWEGWGTVARKGSVKPFLKLVDRLFEGAEPWAKTWFLRWLAYPLQHPGHKLFTSVLVHGRVHGSGKSLLGVTMGRIYGKNFSAIKQKDLNGDFNAWAENKQFVLGDDITGSDNREHTDVLKTLITQEKIRINIKFVPEYEVPDCLNYYFTSNQVNAFFLEDDDRRHFIHEVTAGRMSDEDAIAFIRWRDEEGGAEALFHHLLKLDLGDFNPAAPAPMTQAKDRMIADGRTDLGSWVRQLLDDPDTVLKVGAIPIARDLFTTLELLALHDPHGKGRVTANGLARELRRAGAVQPLKGAQVRTSEGRLRLYAVRNPDRWRDAKLEEVVKHREQGVKRGKY